VLGLRAARAAIVTAVTAAAVVSALAPAASAAPGYAPPSGAWAQFLTDMYSAQGLVTGGVTIAVLDSGADPGTPGLAGKVTDGPDYIFKPQVPLDHVSGTGIAALIVGVPGITAGLVPGARILSLRTLPDETEPRYQSFYANANFGDAQQADAKAIRYAVSHGAGVILTGDPTYSNPGPALLSAVNFALSRNAVIVAPTIAAGEPDWSYAYPSGIPGVIGVAAIDLPDGPAPTGPFVTGSKNNAVLISGPGNQEPVLAGWYIENDVAAASFVAATAALIKEKFPDMPPALVARALAMSARYRPPGGYSQSVGFGVLDAYDAVRDAGALARLTRAARPSVPGTVASAAHFGGGPPGVISALPSDRAYWALVGVGASALACAAVLATRRRRRRGPTALLQQLAQPEQVLHARLDLHPVHHPGTGDEPLTGNLPDEFTRGSFEPLRAGLQFSPVTHLNQSPAPVPGPGEADGHQARCATKRLGGLPGCAAGPADDELAAVFYRYQHRHDEELPLEWGDARPSQSASSPLTPRGQQIAPAAQAGTPSEGLRARSSETKTVPAVPRPSGGFPHHSRQVSHPNLPAQLTNPRLTASTETGQESRQAGSGNHPLEGGRPPCPARNQSRPLAWVARTSPRPGAGASGPCTAGEPEGGNHGPFGRKSINARAERTSCLSGRSRTHNSGSSSRHQPGQLPHDSGTSHPAPCSQTIRRVIARRRPVC
jgi:Subtilase family